MKRQVKSLFDLLLTVGFVVLTFFPYVCIPVGNNTNLPVSSVFAAFLALRYGLPQVPMARIYIMLTSSLVIGLLTVMTNGLDPNIRGIASFALALIPILGFYIVAKYEPTATLLCIRTMVIFTSLFAILQKYVFFDRGIIPFLNLYEAPGYASVTLNANAILLYMKRPFAQFPEPSFLAGTLALAAIAMIFLSGRLMTFNMVDRGALVLALITLNISQSGLVFVAVGVILVFWIGVEKNSSLRLLAIISAPIAIVFAAVDLANRRLIEANWSWVDRLATLTQGFEYTFSNPATFFSGVGIGNTPFLFASNKVEIGLEAFNAAPDIYSVFGRFVMSAGVAGLILLVFVLLAPTWRSLNKELNKLISLAILTTWLTVATLVITYDSAAWVWGFGAIFWGFADREIARDMGVELEDSPSRQLA